MHEITKTASKSTYGNLSEFKVPAEIDEMSIQSIRTPKQKYIPREKQQQMFDYYNYKFICKYL